MYCSNCGEKITNEKGYCSYCGSYNEKRTNNQNNNQNYYQKENTFGKVLGAIILGNILFGRGHCHHHGFHHHHHHHW